MNVFELFAKIDADTSGFENGINKAKEFGTSVLGGIGNVAKIGAGAVAAVGTAVAGTTAAIVHATGGVAEYGDNIDKMSQKMGISAKGYQEWEAVMQHSGTSMETMKASMKTLANAVENGNDAFSRIGLSMEDIASMSNEDIFNATIAGLQNVENETERTYLAGQLLGRGATELGALLNTSAEDTQAMKDRVNELGGVMSDKAVKAAAAYQDQLQDMKTAFSGITRGLTSEFLPSITTVMSGLTDLFSGDSGGISKIKDGFNEFVGNMTNSLPQLLNTGSEIINALLGAISDNLPQLVDAGVNAIALIGDGIISNLPVLGEAALQIGEQLATMALNGLEKLADTVSNFDFASAAQNISDKMVSFFTGDGVQRFIESGTKLLGGLISGIGQALPSLIPAAVEIIYSLGNTLWQNVPTLIDAGLQLITGLAQGIINAIPVAVEGITTCWQTIFNVFGTYGGKILDKVKDIFSKVVSNVVNFMQKLPERIAYYAGYMVTKFVNEVTKLPDKAKELFDKVVTKVKDFGTKFAEVAPQAAKDFKDKLIDGIKDLPSTMYDWGTKIIQGLIDGVKSLWDGFTSLISSAKQGANDAKSDINNAESEVKTVNTGYIPRAAINSSYIKDENGFDTEETGINYTKLANAIVKAFTEADISVECDSREFGRLVRKAVTA